MIDDQIMDEFEAVVMACLEQLLPVFHCPIGFMQLSVVAMQRVSLLWWNYNDFETKTRVATTQDIPVVTDIISLENMISLLR